MSPLSSWVFSAQGGARQKLKICPELPGNKLSESVRCLSPSSNGKRPSTQFLENDEIVFHLAAVSQCEQEVRVIYRISSYAD